MEAAAKFTAVVTELTAKMIGRMPSGPRIHCHEPGKQHVHDLWVRHQALLVDAFDGLDLLVGVAALVGVDRRNRHSSWAVGGSKFSAKERTLGP